jgi:hypothetical protein
MNLMLNDEIKKISIKKNKKNSNQPKYPAKSDIYVMKLFYQQS